jgi:hypothetical protein
MVVRTYRPEMEKERLVGQSHEHDLLRSILRDRRALSRGRLLLSLPLALIPRKSLIDD